MQLEDALCALLAALPTPAETTEGGAAVEAALRTRDWAHRDAGDHRWRGLALYEVAVAMVRVPDTKENRAHFAALEPIKRADEAKLYLALTGLFSLHARALADVVLRPQDGASLAETLAVPDHSLTFFEAGAADAGVLLRARARGAERHFIAPVAEGESLRTAKVLDARAGDALVEMRVPFAVRQAFGLGSYEVVRAIDYHRHGYPRQTFLTSLVDPAAWPRHELAAIHSERWLGAHSAAPLPRRAHVPGERPDEVAGQVWSLLMAYDLVREALATAARQLGEEPGRLDLAVALERLGAEPVVRALAERSSKALAQALTRDRDAARVVE